MKNVIALSLSLLFIKFPSAQTGTEFFNKGDSLFFEAKDYKNSALAYSAGIRAKGKDAMLDIISSPLV